MSRRNAIGCIATAGAVVILAMLFGASRLSAAASRARDAEAGFERTRADARRVLMLRAMAQTVAVAAEPPQGVYRRMNESLVARGLSEVRVKSVVPAGDRALDRGAMAARRVQTVRIVLEPMTLLELGAFLDHWRTSQPLWIITEVDLSAPRQGAYRASITVSAVHFGGAGEHGGTP